MTDNAFTREQLYDIDDQIRMAMRKSAYGRKFFAGMERGPLGFGVQSVTYRLLTEMADAEIAFTWSPEDWAEDRPYSAETVIKMPILHHVFSLNGRDIASAARQGTPLDTQGISGSTYKVALKENAYLMQGYTADGTNYDVSGLYQAAGNTKAGAGFDTATNVPITIAGVLDVMTTDDIMPPYTFGLYNTQYSELLLLFANTGISAKEYLGNIGVPGAIYIAQDLTAGTGIATHAAPGCMDLSIGVEYGHIEETKKLSGNVKGLVYVIEVPRIWDSNCICTITGI